ncbi:unnamed protein product [Arctogadus glacialis]
MEISQLTEVFAVWPSHNDSPPEKSSELGRRLHHADQSAPSRTHKSLLNILSGLVIAHGLWSDGRHLMCYSTRFFIQDGDHTPPGWLADISIMCRQHNTELVVLPPKALLHLALLEDGRSICSTQTFETWCPSVV